MPIPELNADGVLPAGIHACTLAELGQRFGLFQLSDRRVRLFEQLRDLAQEEQAAGLALEMFVDGSFTTAKPEPGDIDLVIVLPADYNPGVELPPFKYNAISKRGIQRRYPFDVFVVTANSTAYFKWVDFYQQIKGSKLRKGILRVTL